MKFKRDTKFDSLFDKIPNLRWIPYVGPNFIKQEKRIFVFAHNIPSKAEEYEKRIQEFSKRSYWADCIEEYTYCKGYWTEAFRYFIKGAVGLSKNYDINSDEDVRYKVDTFVSKIAYLNYIQDLVIGENKNANATAEQHEISRQVNHDFLEILNVTHCICWGSQVFNSLKSIDGFAVESERSEGMKGFSSAIIRRPNGKKMNCLKVFHPSMPGYKPFSESTHKIFEDFLTRD